ncbi:Centromere/kinetochore protein zw10, partial [Phlyctochytrium bullatum]
DFAKKVMQELRINDPVGLFTSLDNEPLDPGLAVKEFLKTNLANTSKTPLFVKPLWKTIYVRDTEDDKFKKYKVTSVNFRDTYKDGKGLVHLADPDDVIFDFDLLEDGEKYQVNKHSMDFAGWQKNEADAMEAETLLSITSHLIEDLNACPLSLPTDLGKRIQEWDGALLSGNVLFLLEAKHSMTVDKVKKVANRVLQFTEMLERSSSAKDFKEKFMISKVIGVACGTFFPQDSRKEALRLGLAVVYPLITDLHDIKDGERYQVHKYPVDFPGWQKTEADAMEAESSRSMTLFLTENGGAPPVNLATDFYDSSGKQIQEWDSASLSADTLFLLKSPNCEGSYAKFKKAFGVACGTHVPEDSRKEAGRLGLLSSVLLTQSVFDSEKGSPKPRGERKQNKQPHPPFPMAAELVQRVLSLADRPTPAAGAPTRARSDSPKRTRAEDADGWDDGWDDDGDKAVESRDQEGGKTSAEGEDGGPEMSRAMLQLCLDGVERKMEEVVDDINSIIAQNREELEAYLRHSETTRLTAVELVDAVLECALSINDPETGLLARLEKQIAEAEEAKAERHRKEVEAKKAQLCEEFEAYAFCYEEHILDGEFDEAARMVDMMAKICLDLESIQLENIREYREKVEKTEASLRSRLEHAWSTLVRFESEGDSTRLTIRRKVLVPGSSTKSISATVLISSFETVPAAPASPTRKCAKPFPPHSPSAATPVRTMAEDILPPFLRSLFKLVLRPVIVGSVAVAEDTSTDAMSLVLRPTEGKTGAGEPNFGFFDALVRVLSVLDTSLFQVSATPRPSATASDQDTASGAPSSSARTTFFHRLGAQLWGEMALELVQARLMPLVPEAAEAFRQLVPVMTARCRAFEDRVAEGWDLIGWPQGSSWEEGRTESEEGEETRRHLSAFCEGLDARFVEKRRDAILGKVKSLLLAEDFSTRRVVRKKLEPSNKLVAALADINAKLQIAPGTGSGSLLQAWTEGGGGLQAAEAILEDLTRFPECVVSVRAIEVLGAARGALDEAAGLSGFCRVALLQTARDALELALYLLPERHRAPHGRHRNLPHLVALAFNDLMYLSHECLRLGHEYAPKVAEELPGPQDLPSFPPPPVSTQGDTSRATVMEDRERRGGGLVGGGDGKGRRKITKDDVSFVDIGLRLRRVGEDMFAEALGRERDELTTLVDEADGFAMVGDEGEDENAGSPEGAGAALVGPHMSKLKAFERCLRMTRVRVERLDGMWRPVLPLNFHRLAMRHLTDHVLARLSAEVLDLSDISERSSHVLHDALLPFLSLQASVVLGSGPAGPPVSEIESKDEEEMEDGRLCTLPRRKFRQVVDILELSLSDLLQRVREGHIGPRSGFGRWPAWVRGTRRELFRRKQQQMLQQGPKVNPQLLAAGLQQAPAAATAAAAKAAAAAAAAAGGLLSTVTKLAGSTASAAAATAANAATRGGAAAAAAALLNVSDRAKGFLFGGTPIRSLVGGGAKPSSNLSPGVADDDETPATTSSSTFSLSSASPSLSMGFLNTVPANSASSLVLEGPAGDEVVEELDEGDDGYAEVARLIRALFADTPLRQRSLEEARSCLADALARKRAEVEAARVRTRAEAEDDARRQAEGRRRREEGAAAVAKAAAAMATSPVPTFAGRGAMALKSEEVVPRSGFGGYEEALASESFKSATNTFADDGDWSDEDKADGPPLQAQQPAALPQTKQSEEGGWSEEEEAEKVEGPYSLEPPPKTGFAVEASQCEEGRWSEEESEKADGQQPPAVEHPTTARSEEGGWSDEEEVKANGQQPRIDEPPTTGFTTVARSEEGGWSDEEEVKASLPQPPTAMPPATGFTGVARSEEGGWSDEDEVKANGHQPPTVVPPTTGFTAVARSEEGGWSEDDDVKADGQQTPTVEPPTTGFAAVPKPSEEGGWADEEEVKANLPSPPTVEPPTTGSAGVAKSEEGGWSDEEEVEANLPQPPPVEPSTTAFMAVAKSEEGGWSDEEDVKATLPHPLPLDPPPTSFTTVPKPSDEGGWSSDEEVKPTGQHPDLPTTGFTVEVKSDQGGWSEDEEGAGAPEPPTTGFAVAPRRGGEGGWGHEEGGRVPDEAKEGDEGGWDDDEW